MNKEQRGTEVSRTKKRASIKDVAKMASVSTATVSRYLNGKYDTMKPSTRHKIAETVDLLDYKPNHMARSLRNSKSKTIGVILADILNPYSIAVLQGIEETCSNLGYSIIVCNTNESAEKERDYIEMLLAKQVDGLLINATGKNNDLILHTSKELPVVLIDRKISTSLDTVTANNVQATVIAMDHLCSRGCNSIAMVISRPDGISPRYERVKTLQDFTTSGDNRTVKTQLFIIERYDISRIVGILSQQLNERTRQDKVGFILGNAVLSMLTLKAARQLGYRIPEDFLMLGFDDPDWASLTQPTLTVMAQPTFDIGQKAVELLVSRLSSGDLPQGTLIELEVEMIERDSTAS